MKEFDPTSNVEEISQGYEDARPDQIQTRKNETFRSRKEEKASSRLIGSQVNCYLGG